MKADLLITGISQLATAEGIGPKRGAAMRDLRVLHHAALAVTAGTITWVGKEGDWTGVAETTIDAGSRAVVPGLVDPHTHAVWAGDRLLDFEARSSGATYESILASGGGIRSTVRATAAASVDDLITLARPRLAALLHSGATTIEVKSGYGVTPAAELAMLEAIQRLAATTPVRILATLLIHIPPTSAADHPTTRSTYIQQVCDTLIPQVARLRLASAIDVFVEKEAWHIDEAQAILLSAQANNLAIKLHGDQFHCIGGVDLGIRLGALSVDHLEASGPQQIAALAATPTIATILPGVSLHLGIPAAPGRKLIDAGAAVAVGTDLNPGSSPLFSTAAALGLAVRLNGLTPQEALVAGTTNAASALGLTHIGRLEPGCAADFLILHSSDWRNLIYTMGANPVSEVWIAGKKIAENHTAETHTAGKEAAA